MPWKPEHKQSTRKRIVEEAAKAYRQFGLHGISTAEIMMRAGLTHGGFYAHFASKNALVAEAVALAGASASEGYVKTAASASPDKRLWSVAESYLSSRHREHPESGCPIAALGSELARERDGLRKKFATHVQALLANLSRCVNSTDEKVRLQQATGTFAAMVGGIILARALENYTEADLLLERVREFVRNAADAGATAALQGANKSVVT